MARARWSPWADEDLETAAAAAAAATAAGKRSARGESNLGSLKEEDRVIWERRREIEGRGEIKRGDKRDAKLHKGVCESVCVCERESVCVWECVCERECVCVSEWVSGWKETGYREHANKSENRRLPSKNGKRKREKKGEREREHYPADSGTNCRYRTVTAEQSHSCNTASVVNGWEKKFQSIRIKISDSWIK